MEGCARTVKAAGTLIALLEGRNMESLHSLINIKPERKELISLVGAGGKTSVMFRLAHELSSMGNRVLVTTTTAIYYPDRNLFDRIYISERETFDLFDNEGGSGITVLGRSISDENKLLGINPQFLDAIFSQGIFDYIITEADGSKKRPVKAPAEHEPVIPADTTKVLGLIGMDSIGKAVSQENVHRTEIFCGILGCREGDIIDSDMLSRLAVHSMGIFKGNYPAAEKYLILNKADGKKEQSMALEIIKQLSEAVNKPDGIIISSIKNSCFLNGAVGVEI